MEQDGRIYQPGTPLVVPAEVPVTEPVASGAVAGQENEELAWAQRHVPEEPEMLHGERKTVPRLVERKTALRGQSIAPGKRPRKARSKTERELLAYDSEIPYGAAEKANRDVVCSLIERQDRVTESLLSMISDMQYRLDDLELSVRELETERTKTGRGVQP